MHRKGIRVRDLNAKVARDAGIRPGDRILRVDGHPVEDELDYRFYAAGGDGAQLEVQFARGGHCRQVQLSREGLLGVVFEPMRSRRCRNRCPFCFVDQMPDGLRRSLYVKDEDYRFSFLYGNYVTLASAKDEELERICRLRLQPLYVSVHATDERVRNFLLGRKSSRSILETLGKLSGAGIELHTQVVLCPGINDGEVLEKTIRDLAEFYPAVASIAIVPVGLTRHRKRKGLAPLRSVGKKDARKITIKIEELQSEFKLKYKENLVFPADEFYVKANHPFPPARVYGGFPQWENGVGMVPLFYQQWERRRRQTGVFAMGRSPEFVTITGELAYPFVRPYVEWLRVGLGAPLHLVPLQNRFLGRSVTVTGLVTGRDVISQIRPRLRPESILLVPAVMVNQEDDTFLDGLSLKEIEEALSVEVEKFDPDPVGFEKVLRKHTKGL